MAKKSSARSVEAPVEVAPAMLAVGQQVFIRSVTHYHVGRVVGLSGQWIELEDAAWIACTDRFEQFLKDGKVLECEPFCDRVLVAVGGVIDVTVWRHKLPLAQK